MTLRINGIVNDSIVDGEGIRLTIFTQGCPHHCPYCHNPQTHDFKGGYDIEIKKIISMMKENLLLDGITLSGGEPMEQADTCAILAEEAKKMGLNVWVYTGYTWEELQKESQKRLLCFTDVLVDGAFIYELRSLELRFKGSANQRIIDVPKSLQENRIIEKFLNLEGYR